jgi:hypothetical protein
MSWRCAFCSVTGSYEYPVLTSVSPPMDFRTLQSAWVLQSKLEELENDLMVISENSDRLKKSQAELSELQLVLEKAGAFFDEARMSAAGSATSDGSSTFTSVDAPLLDDVPVRINSH